MPQLFALEWDSREIRLAVASGRGRQVVIEQAFSIPCEIEGSAADAAERIGKKIAAELDARGLGRGEAVVAVGRNNIELRQLQLPPAPDDDLPDMVRFLASREFNELDDKWLLDFVSIDGSAETPRTVLATAIAPAVLKQIEAVCEQAGLKMRRLLLRPCEAALLLEGQKSIPLGRAVLLVDPLGVEAELTAVVDGTAVFLRTTRFNSDPPPLPSLLAEIRRTMAASSNQLGGRRIESIVLCGDQQSHVELARSIQAELEIPVETFDPLEGVNFGKALSERPPEHPGRFAPLVGMLMAELKPSRHAVDFLHPRRRPAPPDPRKKWYIGGVAAAVLLVSWIIYGRVEHYLLARAVADMQRKSEELDPPMPQAKQTRDDAADIAKWADADVNWLDRTFALNQSFPPKPEMVLDDLTADANVVGRGSISQFSLTGLSGPKGIAQLRETLDAKSGTMKEIRSHVDRSVPPYSWWFEANVMPKVAEKP